MSKIFSAVETVIWRLVDDEVLLLDTNTGNYLSLNRSGSRIWTLLLEGNSVAQIAKLVSTEFGVSEEVVRGDVLAIVDELERERLVEAQPAD